jgi:hypothetical protein
MYNSRTERFLLFFQKLLFVIIGNKLRPGSLKNLVDIIFIISEKIGYNFDIISSNYIYLYSNVVNKEINLANISSRDRILVIGAGSIPSTSIILANNTKAQINSIDIDKKAVIKALLFIEKIGLQNRIHIEYSNGINYPIKNYNIIFILYGVKQKLELLQYLSNNIDDNMRIIYRETNINQNENNIKLSKLFKIENVVKTNSFGHMNSYLLLKKSKKNNL